MNSKPREVKMIDMKKFIPLAILALLIVPASIVAVRSDNGSGPKPSIVLIHGAWADGSSWSRVIDILQQQGYTVYAPANPLRGLTSDAAYIAGFLQSISGPIILVGHSYGGAVITNAATGNPNVKALVYIDAFAPARENR
jgi:pimeloyl-ACP methyl ester carboxylesterase